MRLSWTAYGSTDTQLGNDKPRITKADISWWEQFRKHQISFAAGILHTDCLLLLFFLDGDSIFFCES
jgi:hypothetical protein